MTNAKSFARPSGGIDVFSPTLDCLIGYVYEGGSISSICRGRLIIRSKKQSVRPNFVLADPNNARYTSTSKAAGPLPQGKLSLGGSFISCGGNQ